MAYDFRILSPISNYPITTETKIIDSNFDLYVYFLVKRLYSYYLLTLIAKKLLVSHWYSHLLFMEKT